MADDLIRAVNSSVTEMRRQLKMPICPACDPGDEGSEVLSELVEDICKSLSAYDNAVAREKALWYEGVADDLHQRGMLSDEGKKLMYSWAFMVRKE